MSYNLLSEPIRRFVRDKRWEELRPIQTAAISRILSNDKNYILASRTSSGKTEAAFLPILSKVNFDDRGVQVLYISPLIALINDQFYRVEELCKYLDVTITKWHGEANQTKKKRLIESPNGIVLITPESIEAMFVNKPANVKHLFANLKYVVLDEVHSFTGSDRGIQLKSLLHRLQRLNVSKFSIVGLSATIGDYQKVKEITGDVDNTTVLLDKTKKETDCEFEFYEKDSYGVPLELLKDLYKQTRYLKALIFPNSRGLVEDISVKLKKISQKVGGHSNYFSHHSSVDKEIREYIEEFAKNTKGENYCITCTSTLELGIDIGSVDMVVQVNATNSISSLIQRLGRSGRKEGKKSRLLLYSTEKWSLLQSLACWLLYLEGFIEPQESNDKPYDILLHQALSIVKSTSGILMNDLVEQLKTNPAFNQIDKSEISEILMHLVAKEILEVLQNEFIIGIEGEWVVNSRDFYSVFTTEDNYKVIHAGNNIGQLPLSPNVVEGENILLAAGIWKIKYIDEKAKKIEVVKANDGKIPSFSGGIGDTHEKIRHKMFDVLISSNHYSFLNEQCNELIDEMRNDFSVFDINNIEWERPLLTSNKAVSLYSFSSSKVNSALGFLIRSQGNECIINDSASCLEIEVNEVEFDELWSNLPQMVAEVDGLLYKKLQENPNLISFSKWGQYLPIEYQIELLKSKVYDFVTLKSFLNYKLVNNEA